MKTVRPTTAPAIVRYLIAQRIEIDGALRPCSPACSPSSATATSPVSGRRSRRSRTMPTWRGQNEQGMALAAVAYAKAMRRRQIMVATSSIGQARRTW